MLGLNPGGDPLKLARETVSWHTQKILKDEPDEWSAYSDERWKDNPPGTYGMQPRVLHLLRKLGKDPRHVPASNVVFLRTARQDDLKGRFHSLASLCWPFHEAVINDLGICVILCFGKWAGNWVRDQLEARKYAGKFVEKNGRHWKSEAFRNSNGIRVVVATHPSRADWTRKATDPTSLVRCLLSHI